MRDMLIAPPLHAIVGLPFERTIQLQIIGFKPGMLGYASQHLRTDLIFIMKGENHIGPTGTGKDLVRTGFAFDTPPDTEQRSENALGFGCRPLAHAAAKVMLTNSGALSLCSSRSASTRKARA
jgi:hypothetical protein